MDKKIKKNIVKTSKFFLIIMGFLKKSYKFSFSKTKKAFKKKIFHNVLNTKKLKKNVQKQTNYFIKYVKKKAMCILPY